MIRPTTLAPTGFLLALAATPLALAGPFKEGSIPADSAFVIHLDVDAAKSSKLGKHIIDNKGKFNLEGLDGLVAFGVDPFRDFHSVTIASPKDKPKMGVVTIRTSNSVDALFNHLKTEPHAKTMSVDGLELLSWDDNGTRKYSHMKAEGEDRVVSICDDWEVLTRSLKPDTAKRQSLGTPRAGSIFFFATADLAGLVATDGDDNAKAVFNGAGAASLDAGEADNKNYVKATVQCDQPQTAADLKQVLDGALAFVRLAPRGNPQAAPLAQASRDAKVTAEGRVLTVEASWDPGAAGNVLETLAAMHGNNDGDDDEDDADEDADEDGE